MKAAIVPGVSRPWEIREVNQPKVGPGQVLIKIKASGLCYTDVHISEGRFPMPPPQILGHEAVGEIVEVGPGVLSRNVGDRVGAMGFEGGCGRCEWCARGNSIFCQQMVMLGITALGGHAEYLVAPVDTTVLLPENLSYEQAAPMFCAGYTVWSGLQWAAPKPGETVAILGIGGLGHLALQLSVAAGFHTIAVSHSPEKDELIRGFGVREIARDGKDLARMGGADIVLACGNSTQAMTDIIHGLRPDGELIVMGLDTTSLTISLAELILRRIRIYGSNHNNRAHLYEVLQIAASGKIKAMIETYSLDQAPKAYERVAQGKARFRAVLVP